MSIIGKEFENRTITNKGRASFCYLHRFAVSIFIISFVGAIIANPFQAKAIESVIVPQKAEKIELSRSIEVYSSQGDRIELSSAPDEKGIVRRFIVSSISENRDPNWHVFSLKNQSDRILNRIVSFHHEGSNKFPARFFSPKLAQTIRLSSDIDTEPKRLFNLQKVDLAEADVFRVSLKPFSTATFVAETHGVLNPGATKVFLWSPEYLNDADIWEAIRDQHINRRIVFPYFHLLPQNDDTSLLTFKLVRLPGGAALADTHFIVRTKEGNMVVDLFGAYPSMRLPKGDYILQTYRDGNVFSDLFTVRSHQERDIEMVLKIMDRKQ